MKYSQRIVRVILMGAVISAALAGGYAWAGLTYEQAVALRTKAGYGDKAALETLRTEARKGNQYAQFSLDMLSRMDQRVPQDPSQELQQYRKAAERGYAEAQNDLGVRYRNGQGVPQDYRQAAQWYRKAADQGHAIAQNNLGLCYQLGQGMAVDYGQAAQWFRKAADQGNGDAQNNLGVLYQHGRGVPQSKVVAYTLYNLAAAQDSVNNHKAAKNRTALTKVMTTEELEASQALTSKISTEGHLLNAVDAYLATSAAK